MGAYSGYVRGCGSVTYEVVRALATVPPVAALYTHLHRLSVAG